MSVSEVSIALSTLASIAGLVFLAKWHADYQIERFQQEIFDIRSKLFLMAEEGSIEFDHPAYTMLRTTLDGFLRFGHRMGFLHLILAGFFASPKDLAAASDRFLRKYSNASSSLTPEQKKALEEIRSEARVALFVHILRPLYLVLFPFFFFYYCTRRLIRFAEQRSVRNTIERRVTSNNRHFDRIDSIAFAAGHIKAA